MSKFRRAKLVGRQTKRFVKRNWELIACAVLCVSFLSYGTIQASDAEADEVDNSYVVTTITDVTTTETLSTTTTFVMPTTKTASNTTTTGSSTKHHGTNTKRMYTSTTTTTTAIPNGTTVSIQTNSIREDVYEHPHTVTETIVVDDNTIIGFECETNENGDIVLDVDLDEETSTTSVSTVEVETTHPSATIETESTTTTTIEEEVTEITVTETEPPVTSLPISDADYILMCNCVAHEAGSNSISVYNKALVVEVVMNRVNDSRFPNTIYGVITQKYQFTGSSTYANLGTYSSKVTDSVKEAVDLYFTDPSQFNHGYLYFTGDGKQNHFR